MRQVIHIHSNWAPIIIIINIIIIVVDVVAVRMHTVRMSQNRANISELFWAYLLLEYRFFRLSHFVIFTLSSTT